MAREPVREIEVEVLPPGTTPNARRAEPGDDGPRVYTRQPEAEEGRKDAAREFDDPLIALVSRLMDSVFVIPGTNIRFGLDPIIGLAAGYGDAAAAITSLLLLFRSVKHGVPRIVIARMALNIVLNATVGAIPLVGDAFSFWFKSNERNYELLRQHAGGGSARSSWLFVIAVVGGVGAVLVLTVVAYASMFVMLLNALRGH